jgi:site-specific DNA-methyltransferase (adenine-specific)
MGEIDIRLGDWSSVLSDVRAGVLICDPPYSDRTHKGHDACESRRADGANCKTLGYVSWNQHDVERFVESWSSRVAGWFVVLTDHVLAPVFEDALERAGRYVFAPLPFVASGSRVRLQGDGPACWATWIVVARPRSKEFSKWGALPGAYVLPRGLGERRDASSITGGKPLWLMQSLVRDYSRPGDLVVDPCAGLGTTLLAAAIHNRKAIGAELDGDTFEQAKARLGRPYTPTLFE